MRLSEFETALEDTARRLPREKADVYASVVRTARRRRARRRWWIAAASLTVTGIALGVLLPGDSQQKIETGTPASVPAGPSVVRQGAKYDHWILSDREYAAFLAGHPELPSPSAPLTPVEGPARNADQRKAQAVQSTVEGLVTPRVPASILQRHKNCALFLDRDSASLLERKR